MIDDSNVMLHVSIAIASHDDNQGMPSAEN
jgi:hypothetical protein